MQQSQFSTCAVRRALCVIQRSGCAPPEILSEIQLADAVFVLSWAKAHHFGADSVWCRGYEAEIWGITTSLETPLQIVLGETHKRMASFSIIFQHSHRNFKVSAARIRCQSQLSRLTTDAEPP